MNQLVSRIATLIFAASLVIVATTLAEEASACPSDAIEPFVGHWDGEGLLIPAHGPQQEMVSQDEFRMIDCNRFEISVNYLNAAGSITRRIDFIASAVESVSGPGEFTIEGAVTEGSSAVKMTGTFRRIQDGTLLGTFSAALGGHPAYFTELMNVTATPAGEKEIVRSLQVFAGDRGGPYLAGRVTTEKQRTATFDN